ncbi:glycerophosphodiester phosphodiesterase [Alteraurantiacibacter aestuarii]
MALAALLLVPLGAGAQDMLIIAHRGASGERPEHTLAAYERAIDQGADYIEMDLVPTKDGVLVARHENEMSGTTDVGEHPEFAARLSTRTIDGEEVTGWFTEDFTLAELQTLRARERLPEIRRANTAFDGLYPVPTFAEIIDLVRAKEAETGRAIGIYPEIKHPAYFASIGFDLPEMLVEQLSRAGYRSAADPVFIQSFEVTPLVRLNAMTDLRLVQLIAAEGGPADIAGRSYAQMIAPDGLAMIATYADGIGADISLLLAADSYGLPLVRNAQAAGLAVHGWTLRKENLFLPAPLRSPGADAQPGEMGTLVGLLQRAGVDGVFTDDPAIAVDARVSEN